METKEVTKKICGIDIGLHGALCFITNKDNYTLYDMPTIKIGKRKDVDLAKFISIIKNEKPHTIIYEDIKSIYQVAKPTMLSLGKQIGYVAGIAKVLNINTYRVAPQVWQKSLLKNIPLMNVNGSYKETFYKSVSLLHTLLPEENIMKDFFVKTRYHDGKVDAYLLAYYLHLLLTKNS